MGSQPGHRWVVGDGGGALATTPGSTPGAPGGKKETERCSDELKERLVGLQERLWAEDRRSKQPSDEELAHDFLWRIYKALPRRGEIGVFNRSHYEDVVVVRVRDIVPKKEWQKRYRIINQFESSLTASGTRVVKAFLHISKEEQVERLRKRLEDMGPRFPEPAEDLSKIVIE
jgi:polyphosphate kinase 2 (PPK2 family)